MDQGTTASKLNTLASPARGTDVVKLTALVESPAGGTAVEKLEAPSKQTAWYLS